MHIGKSTAPEFQAKRRTAANTPLPRALGKRWLQLSAVRRAMDRRLAAPDHPPHVRRRFAPGKLAPPDLNALNHEHSGAHVLAVVDDVRAAVASHAGDPDMGHASTSF